MRVTALPNLQVLDLACSYYKAAEVLDDANANAIPIINLRCHAIELFLKSLHLKDDASDIGGGVFLLRLRSGRRVNNDLRDSLGKALQEHRDELLSDMPTLSKAAQEHSPISRLEIETAILEQPILSAYTITFDEPSLRQ